MESEFIALADLPLWMRLVPSMSLHCDCQAVIARARNKAYNGKSRHIRLRHNIVKQLLKDGIISVDFVRSEINLADPLTKPLARKLVANTSRGMGLMPITEVNNSGNRTYMSGDPTN